MTPVTRAPRNVEQSTRPQAPVFDLFIGRDGDAWRLYVGPSSWAPPLLRDRMNDDGEIFPVSRPDLDDLDEFMWRTDSPYEAHRTGDGGAEILAKGRSAVALLVWLESLVAPAPNLRRSR